MAPQTKFLTKPCASCGHIETWEVFTSNPDSLPQVCGPYLLEWEDCWSRQKEPTATLQKLLSHIADEYGDGETPFHTIIERYGEDNGLSADLIHNLQEQDLEDIKRSYGR